MILQTNFKIAFRNLKKHKLYSIINCFGLFAGFFFFFLIGAYVWGEYHINRELKNADRQYILTSKWKKESMGLNFTTLAPLAKRLKEDYPALVENYYRFDGIKARITNNDISASENIQLGDPSLLTMYGFELLYGDIKTALNTPNSVVITSQLAIKYFGKKAVVGQTITIENFNAEKQNFQITGVLKTLAQNTVTQILNENTIDNSLVANLFMPIDANSFFKRGKLKSWKNIYTPSFITLKKGVQQQDLVSPLKTLIAEHTSKKVQKNLKVIPVSLTNYYLNKDEGNLKRNLWTLIYIGCFIILMATVNFVNISISMMRNRVKEIGLKKVLGTDKSQLIIQFLSESFILVFIAEFLALVTFIIFRPYFSGLIALEIASITSLSYIIIFLFLGLLVFIGFLAGFYPAFILSSLSIITSLKGLQISTKNKLQKFLVTCQFSVGLIIVICAILINQQVNYFFKKDLGYNKKHLITAQVPRNWSAKGVQKMEVIRNEFQQMNEIHQASISYETPNGNFGNIFSFINANTPEKDALKIKSLTVDSHFFKTYDISIVSKLNTLNHKNTITLNKAAVHFLGFKNPHNAIGKRIKIKGQKKWYTVKQVIQNFHFDTMKKEIEPLVLFNVADLNIYRYLSLKISPENTSETISKIQKKWNVFFPNSFFKFQFMDEVLQNLYRAEIRFKNVVYYASLIAFIIVLLGVMGLVLLNIQQREKELAVRKILGSSNWNHIILFFKDITFLLLLASVIAFPTTYYFMSKWLNNYAYKIDVSLFPFLIPLLGLLVICLLLITVLILKVAYNTPIKSLKTE